MGVIIVMIITSKFVTKSVSFRIVYIYYGNKFVALIISFLAHRGAILRCTFCQCDTLHGMFRGTLRGPSESLVTLSQSDAIIPWRSHGRSRKANHRTCPRACHTMSVPIRTCDSPWNAPSRTQIAQMCLNSFASCFFSSGKLCAS